IKDSDAAALPPGQTGACCFSTHGCLEVNEAVCLANGGTYQGHGTICWPSPCGGGRTPTPTRPLFVGVQYGNLPTRTTNLQGFPNVTWENGFVFGLNGAAGLPDGTLYLSSGDFNTKLYLSPLEGPPVLLANLQGDASALAYGRGKLYAFSNYGTPMGIYEVNPATGQMTLKVDTAAAGGYRYFALDYNAADSLLYGYTEYGSPTGLHSINVDTGVITPVAASIPAGNSAARGMACGYNKVYAVSVYGGQYPMYVYDLAQGPGGTWQPMTHPFPESNSTSGAAWIPGPKPGDLNCDGRINFDDINPFVLALSDPQGYAAAFPDCTIRNGDTNLDGRVNFDDINPFVRLLTGK
ncbi:MAG: hypothetical protein AB1716_10590, partial [Planctomycetota bacterium]